MKSYWSPILHERISRRKAITTIAAGAAGAAGAALLAACGRTASNQPVDKDTILARVTDETKTVKRGGTFFAGVRGGGYVHMDPYLAVIQPYGYFYSRLFSTKPGFLQGSGGEIVGDLLESWEVSPDKLTITGKVNAKAQFAPVAPVNSRNVDARDVAASWQRWKEIGSYRNEIVNDVEPTAPVLSLTTPDDSTVVIKLKEPFAPILALFAQNRSGNFQIIPREALDQKVLDLRTVAAGSGPWYIKDWQGSTRITYQRNPGYKYGTQGDVPYMDEYTAYFIQEPAVHEAQLRAGSLLQSSFFPVESILRTKEDLPQLQMYRTDIVSTNSIGIIFGHASNSPFKDDRVRKAAMMSYDRQAIIDVAANAKEFADAGIPVETKWESALTAATFRGWYLDPQSKEFGPNVKYITENVEEAKKLLTAAGFPNGVETVVHYPPGYNPGLVGAIQTFLGEFGRTGLIKYKIDLVDYNVEWTPKYRLSRGQIPDMALISDSGADDPTINLYARYNSNGGLYQGGDSTLNDLLDRAVREFDDEKRKALVQEVQRYDTGMLHRARVAGGFGSFELVWPAVRNWQVYQPLALDAFKTVWVDPTKAPFNKT